MSAAAAPLPSRLLPSDLLRVGTLGLRSRRVRTTLSCLGIAIGIAALVAVVGISSSSRSNLLAQLDRLGTGLLTVQPGQDFGGNQAILPSLAPGMTRRVGGVESVTATGNLSDTQVYRTDLVPTTQSGAIAVKAVRPDLLTALNGSLADGAFLNAATVRYPAVVLGAATARQLGIGGVLPRETIWIGDHWFTVVGILAPLELAPEIDSAALIGYPIAEHLLHFAGTIGTIYIQAQPRSIPQVLSLLPRTVDPAHPENVAVSRPSEVLAARGAAANAFTGLLLGLGAVALIVGGIGIANVMVIAVLERRTEIGLRRALGATRRHIAIQFVAEAFALSALGGLAGIVLGALATIVYAVSRGWGVSVPLYAVAGGFAAAVLTGVAAGTYPALRAARLAPTDALRTA